MSIGQIKWLAGKTALVTGGGGFLGRAIVERLLACGCSVRSLSRGDYPELREMGVALYRGDIADMAVVQEACRGCDVVFHTAAKAGIWGPYQSYLIPNFIGTRNVVLACKTEGVTRFVHSSSPSVVFHGGNMEGADESAPYPKKFGCHYSATKAQAEQFVRWANGDQIRTVVLRPHLIWGPRDNNITPRLIARRKEDKLRIVGDGRNLVDTVYIDNAADAHLLAAEALELNPAVAGKVFFISQGQQIPLWEIINRILDAAGQPPVTRRVPYQAAWLAGAVMEAGYRLFGIEGEPRMTRFLAGELSTSHWFDISAARRELGYEPTISVDEGLRRLKEWFSRQPVG